MLNTRPAPPARAAGTALRQRRDRAWFPAAVLCGVLALGGCASTGGLAPELRVIDADALNVRRSVAVDGLPPANFPRSDWWRAFGDAQLDALIEQSLRDGPSLALADARLNAARAQAGLADASRRPTLSAGARYSGVQLPETMLPEGIGGHLQGSDVLTFNFAWSPDLWGAQRAQWEAAVGQVHASQADAQAARLALSADVARRYIALAQAFNDREVAANERERAASLVELTRQRVAAGLDSELQLRNAQTAVGSAQQREHAADQQIRTLRFALAALLGKGPDRGLTIAPPVVLRMPTLPGVPDVVPSELLGQRPDVVAARWRVEAAARGIDVAKAAFRPSINLSALLGAVAPTLSELFNSDSAFALAGPALSLPIFDGGRRRATLAGRNADYDLAVANYNQRLITALGEVADALNSVYSLNAQITAASAALDDARAAHDLALQRYAGGIGTHLDVLIAQRTLLDFEQRLSTLRAQQLSALVDFNQALGGGLQLAPPALATTDDRLSGTSSP